jgi:hypothetical protein
MLGGETKRAFADIFRAWKEGAAALERARGETAALCNLANAARLIKANPELFNLPFHTTGKPLYGADLSEVASDGGYG